MALNATRTWLDQRFGARLEDFRLFGSYARGTWGPESDVDVLVLVNALTREEQREIFHCSEAVMFDHRVAVAPLAFSTAEWREMGELETPTTAHRD